MSASTTEPITSNAGHAVSQTELRRSIRDMVWPAATESLLQLAVGLVNMAMVGRLGAAAIGAVGLSNRLSQIVWALFLTFSTGAVVRIAQAIGAEDRERARHTGEQALSGAVVFMVVLTVVLFALAPQLLTAFHPERKVVDVGISYLRILSLGMPVFTLMLVAGSILRGAGDTKTPMQIALIVNIVNIIGNYLLIFGHLGFPAMGLNGSAIATVFAQFVGAGLAVWVLFNRNSVLRLKARSLLPLDFHEIGRLAQLGFPNACETLAWQLAAVLMITITIRFGTYALAGYQLGLTAEGMSYMPAAAFGIAATAFTGYSVGARNPALGRRYVREIFLWGAVWTTAVALGMFFFATPIMRLLTTDAGSIQVGAVYLRFMAFAQLPQNLANIVNGSLRGAGHTRQPLTAIAVGLWLVRIPLALLFSNWLHFDLTGVWWAIEADLMVRFIISLAYFRRLAFN